MGLSLRNIKNKITDVFDANSQLDQQKRLAAGQPQFYQQQQHPNFIQRDVAAANSVFNGIKSLPGPLQPLTQITDTFMSAASHLPQVHLSQNIQNPWLRTAASLPESVLNTPSSSGQSFQKIRQNKINNLPQLTAAMANTAQLPLLAISPGIATAGKSILARAGAGALTGAAYGGLYGVSQDPNASNVGQQLIHAAPSALAGAALGTAGGFGGALMHNHKVAVADRNRRPGINLTDQNRAQVGQSGYVPEKGVKGGIAVNNSYLKNERGSVPIPFGKNDPNAALKQEALKYKSADEFAASLNGMKSGTVTGVGQLPIEKINKTQIKALTERGLPHTDTNLKVSDFKPGRKVTQPLEVYSKGGSWVVENGNHRLAQALANGDTSVPVVFKRGEGKAYSTPLTDIYNQAHKYNPLKDQGGYIRIPGKNTPDEARQAIIKKLQTEADYFDNNQASIKAQRAPGDPSKVISSNRALFKEFRKDPNKFVDKYKLLPPEMQAKPAAKATPPKPTVAKKAEIKRLIQEKEVLAEKYRQEAIAQTGIDPAAKPTVKPVVKAPTVQPPKVSAKLEPSLSSKPSVTPTKNDLKIGKGLGMSEKDVAKAKAEMATTPTVDYPTGTRGGVVATKEGNVVALKRTQAAIDAQKLAPAPLKLRDVNSGQDAIRVGESVSSNFNQTANALANNQDKILGKSLKNRDLFVNAIEHPNQAAKIASQFQDPQAFLALVDQHKAVTNMEYSSFTGAGKARPFNSTYIHHNVDLSTPEAQKAYDALSTTIKGGTSQARLHPTLEDLRANGLDLRNKSAGDATRAWASRQTNIIRDATLENRLKTIDPNIQVVQIPGENPRFFSGDKVLNKELKGVQPYSADNPLLKSANAVNTGVKQVSLFGGGFHDFKTTIRQFTTDVASGRNPFSRLAEGNKQMASSAEHAAWNQKQLDAGYGQIWADADVAKTTMGQDLHGGVASTAKDLTKGSVENLNPYMKRLFNNKLDYYKKQLVIDEAARNGITPANYDPNNPAMRKIVEQAGQGAQHWFGGENLRIAGRSPIVQQILKFTTLAPDFSEGKLRAAAGVVRGGEMGSLARRQVISEAVGVAILAEAASKGLTGKFTNPGQALLDPQIKTNMKDKQGRPLEVGLPGSTIADAGRLVKDPAHFATSHAGALASVGVSAATGKDYYGSPLVDPFKNPNPNFGQNLVAALKSKGTIPGVQIQKTVTGKQSALTGVINTLGGRVNLDKSAPQYQETQAYFKAKDNFTKNLNPNDLALFNKLNPTKKDASGKSVLNTNTLTKPSDYADLLGNDNFLKKYQGYQQSQKSHDPLWDLKPNELRSYLQAQVISKNDPGGDGTTVSALYKNVPANFFTQREQYFAGLKASGVKLSNSDYKPKPAMPDNLVQFSQDYHNLPYGTGQRSAALRSATGQAYINYLNQNRIYNNQERADLGLPPLEDPSSKYGSSGGTKKPLGALTPKKMTVAKASTGKKSVSYKLPKTRVKVAMAKTPKGSAKIKVKKSLV